MSNMFKGCQLLKTIEGNFKMSSNPDNNRKKVFTNFFLNEKDEEDITYIETKQVTDIVICSKNVNYYNQKKVILRCHLILIGILKILLI